MYPEKDENLKGEGGKNGTGVVCRIGINIFSIPERSEPI